jgi:hypothetical protein
MARHPKTSTAAQALSPAPRPRRPRYPRPLAAAGLIAAAALALGLALPAAAATAHAASAAPSIIYGTLDTQTAHAATEEAAGVHMAMFELAWNSFEPTRGTVSPSYLATMKSELAAYRAAGQQVTLGLGLENTPAWVFALPDSTYTDQKGNVWAGNADLVYSAAVRTAAAQYLSLVAANLPMADFWAIRLGSGSGDGEMLYPGNGTYMAFGNAALTGTGLAAGMTPNPDPSWKPGTAGLTQPQIAAWVSWYIGGLDNVTGFEMTTLAGLGFTGYYETLTPGSGTRPDDLATTEKHNLNNDGTTGVGAVWNLYYNQLPDKTKVIAYISSVADQSGGNDSCQPADTTLPLTSTAMDSWSATRWITRIAAANGLLTGGENPGYGLPASLETFYTNTTSAGMMATALAQARSCGFTVFYWAHDIHLWDGTIPFTTYTTMIAAT